MTWAQEIQNISESPEYQTSRIRILDSSLDDGSGQEYDPDTGTWTGEPADITIYNGQARVIPIREGNFSANTNQANPTTITPIRVQIPRTAATDIRIRKGCTVIVDSAPATHLNGRLFTVSDDIQGGTAASRTFTAYADIDTVVAIG
jgi:hypothetical protein